MLEISGLSKTYASVDGRAPVEALRTVDLQVGAGEFVSIIGPSGCGKSTLLSIVAGLLAEYEGEVRIGGARLRGPHPSVGVVFQEESTFPWLTAIDNVAFGLKMRGVPRAERLRRAQEMIDVVGLSGFERRYPGELSGGMRQRVAIARALVLEPSALLMDEPFGALDEQTRIILGEELLRLQERFRQTVLFVTHNINEAVQLSDRVVVMTARPGRIKEVLMVDIPRPRDSTVIVLERFGTLVAQLWGLLREESLRGFQQAVQEGG